MHRQRYGKSSGGRSRSRNPSTCMSGCSASTCDFSMVVACFCHFKLRSIFYVLVGMCMGFSVSLSLRSVADQGQLGWGLPGPCRMGQAPRTSNDAPVEPSRERELIFIGVMTAEKFLETRAAAINQTWGQHVPGRLVFFVGGDVSLSKYAHLNMPIVALRHVTDGTYPPQKKSFLMLRYMFNTGLVEGSPHFDWYMRVDDDAYVRGDRLEGLLRGLNASQPVYMGQTGLGNKEEYGHLSLGDRDNYCMGGTGMIFSRRLMELVVPRLGECMRELYTMHEDVEIGRCVRRYAGVSCTWAYEVSLFE